MGDLTKRLLNHLEEWLLGAILALMALTTFVQIVARHCGTPISFTEEVVRYLLVWITMLGIAAAAKRGSHIRVHAVSVLFPRLRVVLLTLAGVCACLFLAVLVLYGAKVVWTVHRTQRTEALNWPMWWAGMSIPVGAGLAIARTAQAWWRAVRGVRPDGAGDHSPSTRRVA